MKAVFLLALLNYNAHHHEVSRVDEIDWYISHSDCLTAKQNAEQSYKPYNGIYTCLPIHDNQKYRELRSKKSSSGVAIGDGKIQIIITLD